MKRNELLQQFQEKKETLNIERIINTDKHFIATKKLELQGKIQNTKDSIEDYLKNPELNIGEAFINLISIRTSLESDLKQIEEIEKYL